MSRDLPSLLGLRGQAPAVRALEAALSSGAARVGGGYLLHGPPGVGRGLGALAFAAALLCGAPRGAVPCGACRSCALFAAGTHPDLLLVSADAGPHPVGASEAGRLGPAAFSLAALRDGAGGVRKSIRVHALRRLLELTALVAALGGRKVVVVDALDDVDEASIPTLLKSLEEPPPATTFVLLAGDIETVPDTIVSRCQRIRFQPLAPDVVRSLLLAALPLDERPDAAGVELAVRVAQGSAGRALHVVRSGLLAEGPAAVAALLDPTEAGSAEPAVTFVEGAGRDLAERRARAGSLVLLALLTARDRAAAGGSSDVLDAVVPTVAGALESLRANVAPDLVLRGLRARAKRAL